MNFRKTSKKQAKHTVKKHYRILLFACLIAIFFGTEFSNPFKMIEENNTKSTSTIQSGAVTPKTGAIDIIEELRNGDNVQKQVKETEEREVDSSKNTFLGHRRGLLAKAVNSITSGSIVVTVFSGVNRIIGSRDIVAILLIVISMIVVFLFWILVINVYSVVLRRVFLESHIYDRTSIQRLTFLKRVKRWRKASWAMFRSTLYLFFWTLTIIGGLIKVYSYRMVSFIIAENPNITGKQAIKLSRDMMYGHKWECFVLDITFLGWRILNSITFGLVGVFFYNQYRIATDTEYYTCFRKDAIENNVDNSDLLDDIYLYEKPDAQIIFEKYTEAITLKEEVDTFKDERTGLPKVLSNIFGISLKYSTEETLYQKNQTKKVLLSQWEDIIDGNSYPARLNPVQEVEKIRRSDSLNFLRSYTVWSLIIIFFVMAFIGWVWEVSLHLISDGVFVNRGVLHGPWLPIYGTGSVLILIVLNKLRKNMAVQFVCAVVLCGIVEYSSSWYLQMAHHGKKWWDYSGYFLNINGRVCAEGLFVFGLGGLVIVYLIAPFIDNFIRKIPGKIIIPICLVLLGLFGADQIYSSKHPNTGRGITDYAKGGEKI